MTAAELLADLQDQGFQLSPEGAGLRVRFAARLTPEQRQAIRTHKAELLALLRQPPPWSQGKADALIAELQARRRRLWGESGWPRDRNHCPRLWGLMDALDAAYLSHDLPALRVAVERFWDP